MLCAKSRPRPRSMSMHFFGRSSVPLAGNAALGRMFRISMWKLIRRTRLARPLRGKDWC